MTSSCCLAFLILGYLFVVVATSTFLFRYSQREVSWLPFTVSLVIFVLSVGTVALVPFDVWETLSDGHGQPALDTRLLTAAKWYDIYWLAFVLSWIVAPILIEYEAAGGFSVYGRFRGIAHRNPVWSAGYFIFALAFLGWLIVGGGIGLRAWCIVCTNTWGLLLATVLMGYGLVAAPKHLWRLARPGDHVSAMYCAAISVDGARLSALFELQDVNTEARIEIASRSSQMWNPSVESAFGILQTTLEECEQLHCELTNGARGPREGGQACGGVSRGGGETDDAARLESLTALHGALKQASLGARRAACRWEDFVRVCISLEDLEEQLFPSAAEVATSWQGSCASKLFQCSALRSCYHGVLLLWLRTLRHRMLRVAAVLSGALSAAIAVGQLTMFLRHRSFSLLAQLFTSSHGFWSTQIFCFVPLSYLLCVSYWSIFRLRIAGLHGLHEKHSTDTGSLLWCASALARLTAPLCYHFLLLVRVENTAFQEVLNHMKAIPFLGDSFNDVFPMLVAILCLCNLFNVYTRVIQLFGLDSLDVEWVPPVPPGTTDSNDLLAEGRRLVSRERRRLGDDRSLLLELHEQVEDGRSTIPLRLKIQALIEDGTLPTDWNAHCPP